MIKKLFFVAFIAIVFTACNNDAKQDTAMADNQGSTEIMTVDQLSGQIADLVGKVVTVAGDVDHTCKHGGTKMVIIGDSTDIHIKATEESGNFRADEVMDHRVIVTGIVDEFKVDENYIMEQEAKLEDLIAAGPQDEENTESSETGKLNGEKGMFPDNDNKHKQEITGLKNQIENLNKMLTEAKDNGKDHVSFYSVKAQSYLIDENAVVKSRAEHFDDGAAEKADEKESNNVVEKETKSVNTKTPTLSNTKTATTVTEGKTSAKSNIRKFNDDGKTKVAEEKVVVDKKTTTPEKK